MSIETYFDYNATTPLADEVKAAMIESFDLFANPSANYKIAAQSKKRIQQARESVARLINAEPEQIIFTSGGTEANNWILQTIINSSEAGNTVICSAIEHDSVLTTTRHLCNKHYVHLKIVRPEANGIINAQSLKASLENNTTTLVTVMLANNETGAIQPIAEIAQLTQEYQTHFHVDAVQAVGKIKVDVKALNCDSLSLSGHKFYGPKGVGVLYVRNPEKLTPWVLGGSQEKGYRSGTENIIGIAGLGVAADLCQKTLNGQFHDDLIKRQLFLQELSERKIAYTLNSPANPIQCLPNTVNLSFPHIRAEALAAYLSMTRNIAISIGSACSNNKIVRHSHVLKAMGLEEDRINGAVRISFGKYTSPQDITYLADSLLQALQHLNKFSQAA